MDARYITVLPRATEKAYAMAQSNVYVFEVPLNANKNEISQAVAEQFNVTVINIKTLVQAGKAIRYNKGKGTHPGMTHRKDLKKAYVTLAEGDSIKMFDETPVSEEKAPAKASAKDKK